MSQFVNSYNSQNGVNQQPISPGQNYPGNWGMSAPASQSSQHSQYVDQNPNQYQYALQQGWKPYSPQPQPRQIPVVGRWVESFDEIKPQEVQMDGNLYLFPQIDRQCIYARFWDNNGTLLTYRFLPEKNEPQQTCGTQDAADVNSFFQAIDARLDSLESKQTDILNALSTKTSPRTKATAAKEDEK